MALNTPKTVKPEKLSWLERWIDSFLGSDPGLTRLIMASRTILTIGAIMGTEYLFVHITHALQFKIPAGAPANIVSQLSTANHEFLVIAILIGSIIGMMSSFGVNDSTAKGQLITILLLPCFMIPALSLGLLLGGHRFIGMASLAVILSLGAYLRRFGPRGFIGGAILFIGDFMGFFIADAIKFKDIGWLSAEIGVGLLTATLVRFILFYPNPARSLRRIQKSYSARSRKVVRLALTVFDEPTDQNKRRLRRQLVRLNETALMIDAQLGDPNSTDENTSNQQMHQELFNIELSLTNIARFTPALKKLALSDAQFQAAHDALQSIASRQLNEAAKSAKKLASLTDKRNSKDELETIIPHRFANSVLAFCEAVKVWNDTPAEMIANEEFTPAVNLFAGWLPGSSRVSAAASRETGNRGLQPYSRVAIQMFIATSLAIFIGDQISPRRFYWAVIAAFITFMGVNNSGEQVRKALYRVVGTIVGIGLGSLLVNLIGPHSTWSLVTILVALFFGLYLMRISYVFMVIGVTIMVSQLYVELGEFSNSLLLLRLEETALGAVIAILVVTFVIPLKTRNVLNVALRQYIDAVSELVKQANDIMIGKAKKDATLHAQARAVDAAYQAFIATARPLRRSLAGRVDEDVVQLVRLTSASRNFSRNLVADVTDGKELTKNDKDDLKAAIKTLQNSLKAINQQVQGKDSTYTRSSSLFDKVDNRLAVRDLQLLDGAMAQVADHLDMTLADYDTA